MAGYDLIEQHVDHLRATLAWRPDVDDLVDEARDHLMEATDRAVADGCAPEEAQRASIERFGEPKVVARALATTPRGAVDAPSHASRAAGVVAGAAAAAWLLVGLIGAIGVLADDGDSFVAYVLLALAVALAGVLSLSAACLVWSRHGRALGALGVAGLAALSLGVLLTVAVAWAVPVWMALQGLGLVLFALALLRHGQAPVAPTVVLGASLLAGLGTFALVGAMGWGEVDSYGDRPMAVAAGLAVGGLLMSVGLAGLARWLRSEQPAELWGAPAAT